MGRGSRPAEEVTLVCGDRDSRPGEGVGIVLYPSKVFDLALRAAHHHLGVTLRSDEGTGIVETGWLNLAVDACQEAVRSRNEH